MAKGRDKGEEAMEWEADTKDVLEQLLRDDVTVLITSVETDISVLFFFILSILCNILNSTSDCEGIQRTNMSTS